MFRGHKFREYDTFTEILWNIESRKKFFIGNSGGRSYIVTSLAELLNNILKYNKILKLNKKFF